jgi:hypothetical protein
MTDSAFKSGDANRVPSFQPADLQMSRTWSWTCAIASAHGHAVVVTPYDSPLGI